MPVIGPMVPGAEIGVWPSSVTGGANVRSGRRAASPLPVLQRAKRTFRRWLELADFRLEAFGLTLGEADAGARCQRRRYRPKAVTNPATGRTQERTCGEGLRRQLSARSDWMDFCHTTLSFEIVLPDAYWLLLFRLFRRLRVAKMVSSIVQGSALPPIS